MKKVAGFIFVGLTIFTLMGVASETEKKKVGPDVALKWLEDGNKRFVSGKMIHPHQKADRWKETVKNGQQPYATLISCSDSRVPVEVLFDEGIGDLFLIRVAGNVCDIDEIASAEYGVDHLGTSLLVVLGHTHCGAVTAVATDAPAHGNLAKLLDNIVPAVDKVKKEHPELKGKDLVPAAVEANVWQGIEDILKNSSVLRKHIQEGTVRLIGAIYDLETGKVTWLGSHPKQDVLLAVKEIKEETKSHEASAVKEEKPIKPQAAHAEEKHHH